MTVSRGLARLARAARRLRRRPPIVDDLAGWCAERGIDVAVLTPAGGVTRQMPAALESPEHPNFARRATSTIRERRLACLPDARLWGTNGLIVLPDGSFLAESTYDRGHLK